MYASTAHSFAGGTMSRTVTLGTDRDMGTTNLTLRGSESSSGSTSTITLQGTTYHSSSTGNYVTYQIAFVMRNHYDLGASYQPQHDWGGVFYAKNAHIVVTSTASSSYSTDLVDYSYGIYAGGKEYKFGSVARCNFMFDSGSFIDAFDFYADYVVNITVPYDREYHTFTIGCAFDSVSLSVTDYGLHSSSDDVVGAVNNGTASQDEGNEIAKEGNNIAQDTANTTHSIFDKISEFFSGFFDGIINALKSLFIPDDEFFSDFFTRLNDFFSEKLGALYTPIDLFIRLLQAIQNAGAGNAGIPFPGIEWDGTYIIEPQTVNLQSIADDFDGLQDKIYFVTDVIMVGAVIWLLQSKLREVLKG